MRRQYVVAGVDVGFRHTGVVIALAQPVEDNDHFLKFAIQKTYCISPKVDKFVKKDLSVAACDMLCGRLLYETVLEILTKWGVCSMVCEHPTGASKSGRAARCMSMASAVFGCIASEMGNRTPLVNTQYPFGKFLAKNITPNFLKAHVARCFELPVRNIDKRHVGALVERTFNPDLQWGAAFPRMNLQPYTKWPVIQKYREHVMDAAGALFAVAATPEYAKQLMSLSPRMEGSNENQ